MKKSFLHVKKDGFDVSLKKDNVGFFVKTTKLNDKTAKLQGKIAGRTPHICDRCGDEFGLDLDEEVEVLASDGLFESQDLENVIEFFDGFINYEEVFLSELEAIKSDYFYCEKCKKLKGE